MTDEGQPISGTPHVEVPFLSLNLSAQVGADDSLIAVRVVPDGREGRTVFARTLAPGEPDPGTPVVYDPAHGESLTFRASTIRISVDDIERHALAGPGGQAPVTNTVWTWLQLENPLQPEGTRFLLATARRLDGCVGVLDRMVDSAKQIGCGFVKARTAALQVIALAEIFVVALSRALDMLSRLEHVMSAPPAPQSLIDASRSITPLRDAFEHIEDRALGQVRGRAHSDALSVFDQRRFFVDGTLCYASHTLDLNKEVPALLRTGRQYIVQVLAHRCGAERSLNQQIVFPGKATG
jgi:hypothetical protein